MTQSATKSRRAAISAWRDNDAEVVEIEVAIPEASLPAPQARVILAAKATSLGRGRWHYEFAVQNLNSDRSIGSFGVAVPKGATITEIGFHDVFYHSGGGEADNYDGTDWPATVTSAAVEWSTVPFAMDPLANAIRWGTLYNFRFDSNRPPRETVVTLGLFKPVDGLSDSVAVSVPWPQQPDRRPR